MSAFLQVAALATLIVAALVVGGVMPVSAFTRFLPANWLKESPLPARSAEATEGAEGGGAGGAGPRSGYGSVEGQSAEQSRREATSREEERQRAERQERAAAGRPDCDSEARINLLSVRYGDWGREDLALIACRRLREGFTEDQLVASRGRPLRRTRPEGQSNMEVWVYRDMRVVLDSDRVVSIRQQ